MTTASQSARVARYADMFSAMGTEPRLQIMRLLLTVVRSEGITALVATHDEALMDLADEVLRLEDGHVTD